MDERRGRADIPAEAQRAMDEETPSRGISRHGASGAEAPGARGPEPLLSQTEATRRIADQAFQQAESHRRDLVFRRNRELLVQDLRALERDWALLQLDGMTRKAEELPHRTSWAKPSKPTSPAGSSRSTSTRSCCCSTSRNSRALLANTDED